MATRSLKGRHTRATSETRFGRSSRVVVLFAGVLLLFGIGFKAYRFTLPTEGWSLTLDFNRGLIFEHNLLGRASPFQPGDVLLEVAGTPMVDVFAPELSPEARAAYQVGKSVPYTVQRGEQILTFEVSLHHWTLKGIANAFAQVFLYRVSQFSPFLLLELALALFIFIKRPANTAAQLLLLMFVTSLVSGLSWVGSPFAPGDATDPLARVASIWLGADINPLLSVPLFVHLAFVFPRPKWGFDRRWPVLLFYALPLALYGVRALVPSFPADVVVPLYFVLMVVAYIDSLLQIKEPVMRAQMKWLAYAGVLWGIGSLLWVSSAVLHWLPATVANVTQWLPLDLVFVVFLGLAILKYRLFDIDVIINRTLVYGALSAGILVLYLAVVGGSSVLLQRQTPLFALLVTATALGLLIKPLLRGLRQGANRLVPLTSVNGLTSAAPSSLRLPHTPSETGAEDTKERPNQKRKLSRSAYLVIGFAAVLVLASAAQKAYRLSLPFEGWSTTTDFESDEPVIDKKLLDVPSELHSGDRVVAVNGLPFGALAEAAIRGRVPDLGTYAVGQTVDYTVLRGGELLEVPVPLYRGTQVGWGTLLRTYFTSGGVHDLIGWLGFWLVVFLMWKRPNNRTAQLLFLQGVCGVASAISWTITPFGIADALRPVTFYSAAFFTHLIHLLLYQPLALHMILSFPKPSPVLNHRWVLPLIYGIPWLLESLEFVGVPFYHPFLLVALYSVLGILAATRLFVTVRGTVETAQVRWFAFGFVFANLGLVAFALRVAAVLPPSFERVFDVIPGDLIYFACIAIAILRYRLFDINIILNRTIVYGGLTAGVVGLYMLLVGGFGQLLKLQNNVGVSLVATGLIAVAFNPLRERLQRGANRLLYGERDDPYQVLSTLGHRIEGTLEPSKVLPAITETVAQVLKLPYASVVLMADAASEQVAKFGVPKGDSVSFPLTHQGETIGEMQLEPRAGESFKPAELDLLKTIAQQASVAAYALRQSLALQRSREALVTAREEERLRIRRDLHDGLGPELASITLKLEAAKNLLAKQPEQTGALLLELKAQTQAAIADVRRLVYALRPPALDQLGLEGALREQVRQCEAGLEVRLEITGALHALPAAAEVACYRIVQEALTNVLRHAKATTCSIEVDTLDQPEEGRDLLSIEVVDDGTGLPDRYRAGVGLRSMRERAEELGGSFRAERLSTGGTYIRARLPLGKPGG